MPLAAYLYLDRLDRLGGDKVARTERHGAWLVDYFTDGRAIGIEFTQTGSVDLPALSRILTAAHQPEISAADLVPLEAACVL
jgi:hypothetical protein